MSLGYGYRACLACADENTAIYTYCCYNLNIEGYDRRKNAMDGEITIELDAIPEPEIHEKLKRFPSGRKRLVVKRLPRNADIDKLIAEGKITVKNASGTWRTWENGVDTEARRVLWNIFDEYQITGALPKDVSGFR